MLMMLVRAAGFATTRQLMLAGVAHKAPAVARDAQDACPVGIRGQLMLLRLAQVTKSS